MLVAADREHLLELVDDEHRPLAAPRAALARAPPADARPGASAPGASARSRAARRSRAPAAGPARTAEDLPLPDGPTTASSGEPTSRATSSATSRSRPKKYSAWAASKVASPRNGQTAGSGALRPPRLGRAGRARRAPAGEQVAGQIGLGGAQLAALAGGAAGARPGRLGDPRPRPLRGRAMHGERNASALRGERLDGTSSPRRQVEARDLRDGLVPERAELERPLAPSRKGRAAGRACAARRATEAGAARATDRGGAIEHVAAASSASSRTSSVERSPRPRAEWRRAHRRGGARVRVDDGHPPRSASRASSAASRVLPMPARARDEHHAAAPLARVGQQLEQLGELPVPAREQRRAALEPAGSSSGPAAHRARDPARGSRPAARAARRPARRRPPRPASPRRCGTPRAPRPGGRSGTARASAGRAGARAAAAPPRRPRARRPGPRGAPSRARPRPAPRTPPSAAPPAGRSRPARTTRRRDRTAAGRATARAPARNVSAAPSGSAPISARPRATSSSKRSTSRSPGPTFNRYALPCVSSRPFRPSACRSADTWLCSILWAVARRRLPPQLLHQPIARDQLVRPKDQQASSARCRPVPIESARPPSPTTSRGPSSRKSKAAATVTPGRGSARAAAAQSEPVSRTGKAPSGKAEYGSSAQQRRFPWVQSPDAAAGIRDGERNLDLSGPSRVCVDLGAGPA